MGPRFDLERGEHRWRELGPYDRKQQQIKKNTT